MIKKAYLYQHLWGYLIAPKILLVLANGTGYMLMFCFPRIFHQQGKGGKSTMNRNSPSSFIKCTGQCFRVVCVCCMCVYVYVYVWMCVCVYCMCACECSMAV